MEPTAPPVAPPPLALVPRTAAEAWPEHVGSVTLEDLVGTPEWLDALAALPPHERIAQGLTFKLHDVTNGEAAFLADFDREVPTAAAIAARYPAGRYVVRASMRRKGRGGGNLTEVRVTIGGGSRAPAEGEGRAFQLLRDVLVARGAVPSTARLVEPIVDVLKAGVAELAQAARPAAPEGAAAPAAGGSMLHDVLELIEASGLAPQLLALAARAFAPAPAVAPAAPVSATSAAGAVA